MGDVDELLEAMRAQAAAPGDEDWVVPVNDIRRILNHVDDLDRRLAGLWKAAHDHETWLFAPCGDSGCGLRRAIGDTRAAAERHDTAIRAQEQQRIAELLERRRLDIGGVVGELRERLAAVLEDRG